MAAFVRQGLIPVGYIRLRQSFEVTFSSNNTKLGIVRYNKERADKIEKQVRTVAVRSTVFRTERSIRIFCTFPLPVD